ncbi:TPA: DUF4263 domain-containing protein [Vibrio parahaemolyticus]|nr:DUF4263 domain-containing protein [Vibrio parahaemolyticus]
MASVLRCSPLNRALELRGKKLINQFEALYKDKSNKEQVYQTFLEDNSLLIPRAFVQNHGIHMELVFRKFPLGTAYKSDFMFLTKSSSDWHAVHIEIEDPNKKIFTKNGCFTAEFNAAVQQVNSWAGWLSHPKNQQTFETDIEIIKKPLGHNPVKHKFVLVYGRRNELNTQTKRDQFGAIKTADFSVMTYDSLFEANHKSLYVASYCEQKVKLLSAEPFTECFFGFLNPADFIVPKKMKKTVLEQLQIPTTGPWSTDRNRKMKEYLDKWQSINTY